MRACSFLALAALASVAPSARAQFSVDPVIANLSVGSESVTTQVRVRNLGSTPSSYTFYFSDFDQTATGDNVFLPLGSTPHSCGDRVSVTPNAATIGPGQTQTLMVQMAPGAETCWAMMFADTRLPGANGITIGQRVGVKIYGLTTASTMDGEVQDVEATMAADSVRVSFTVRNLGTAPIRPSGRIEIRALDGTTVAHLEVEPFSVLPGYTRRETYLVPATLPAGQYLALPILDFGADYLIAGQATFDRR